MPRRKECLHRLPSLADAEFLAGLGGLLLQSAGGGNSDGTGADYDVEFHVLALRRYPPFQASTALSMSSMTFLASPNTIIDLSM